MTYSPALSRYLTVVFHNTGGDGFVAECLEIPGCLSQGDTEPEALKNIQDAIQACLLVLLEDALNNASSQRDLGAVNYTDVSRQARIRMTPGISTEEAVA